MEKIKKILRQLFDYQRYEENDNLKMVIDDVQDICVLSDDELLAVNAGRDIEKRKKEDI